LTNAKPLALLLAACALAACGGAPDPAVFDAGLENQAGLTFSPDGSAAYWVAWDGEWGSSSAGPRTIFTSRRQGRAWSSPRAMPFSGEYSDNDPFVSPDGQWLYFVSERPNADIWRYRLDGSEMLERLAINSEAAEYSPVVVASGALYFASARPGGPGRGDLYRAAPDGDGFAEPVVLGSEVNSPTGEWNLWVSPDESWMIFEASGRPTNVSIPGDLYVSRRATSGWTSATPLIDINEAGSDLLPRMHPDGDTLYYTAAPIGGHASVNRLEAPFGP
jgi:Tol biopolymer transport system component